MIAVRKLLSLSPQHCARKASQTLAVLEARARDGDYSAGPWLSELAHALSGADWIEPPLASLCVSIIGDMQQAGCEPDGLNYTRSINRLRRGLEAFAGVSPADWDFSQPLGLGLDGRARAVFPGMMAYLEDIRSPFNVGSAFRTADAFGLAGIVLSDFCPSPEHPRAERSAMGASAIVPWRRGDLSQLSSMGEAFALELRGQALDEFSFPERGVVILGSEELGVSPEALSLCKRRVSIPMLGAKGSLNVGVAFGILLYAWRLDLLRRGVVPIAPAG
ncbi:MAG TPA: TrmH family RNA methyltransferase [Spirochaetales bacterium]|nr:TrmH family RNA methyltransferase [Spirochaetales bacterium]